MGVSPKQEHFINGLMSGLTISQAARMADVPRRTATYWMHESDSVVRVEFERRRISARLKFNEKLSHLQEKSLSVLDELLNAKGQGMQLQVARLILWPESPIVPVVSVTEATQAVIDTVTEYDTKFRYADVMLYDDQGHERLPD